ncbi:hypothetical protein [Blastococcus capsensis]|uniref:hypothetical protein n=1 Tax=Blastococcus capsensis TaxID=1564163 RepID=UPI0025425E2A|nr:hypothetical protein [Blastococcus capsensis]MDK3255262.1 hypothetical protein [Blastococcus capsensis]
MDGPDILVRTLSQPTIPDKFGNFWQYHSRSDRHSKVACWTILFDLLQHSRALARHIEACKVVLGVNQQMRDLGTNRAKNLDLVISRPAEGQLARIPASMSDLALRWGVRLTPQQRATLTRLPDLREGLAGDVLVALEAKACMTAHVRALPRLFDELTSSHSTVHAGAPQALAVGYALVNASESFVSADMNKYDLSERHPTVNQHPAHAAGRVVTKVLELDGRTGPAVNGFDALGVTVISMRNDGSPVSVVSGPPAPDPEDAHSYKQMVGRVAQSYDETFADI